MRFTNDYWFLSNLYPTPITYKGYTFKCVESAFQSQKATDEKTMKLFVNLSGEMARYLGTQISVRRDWNSVRDSVMEELLRIKFSRPVLMEQLRDTGYKSHIQEDNSLNETYWGICKGYGQNKLGKLLMKIRDEAISNDNFANPNQDKDLGMALKLNGYRLIVAGTRDFDNYSLMEQSILVSIMNGYFREMPQVIVSGMARGADSLGMEYAIKHQMPIDRHPARWDLYGKVAGYLRNEEMSECADGLIAFWDGESTGTASMIELAKSKGLDVVVVLGDEVIKY